MTSRSDGTGRVRLTADETELVIHALNADVQEHHRLYGNGSPLSSRVEHVGAVRAKFVALRERLAYTEMAS